MSDAEAKFHREVNTDISVPLKGAFETFVADLNTLIGNSAGQYKVTETSRRSPIARHTHVRTLAIEGPRLKDTQNILKVEFTSNYYSGYQSNGTARIAIHAEQLTWPNGQVHLKMSRNEDVLRGKKSHDGVYVDLNNAVRTPAQGESTQEIFDRACADVREWMDGQNRSAMKTLNARAAAKPAPGSAA